MLPVGLWWLEASLSVSHQALRPEVTQGSDYWPHILSFPHLGKGAVTPHFTGGESEAPSVDACSASLRGSVHLERGPKAAYFYSNMFPAPSLQSFRPSSFSALGTRKEDPPDL